jgi:GT2 family glycosyltransferase
VIDNNSTDDSVETIKTDFPDINLIENPKNFGVAKGRNIGVEYALKKGAAFVLILDNDTIVDPQFLTGLVQASRAYPLTGIAGPLIYYYEQPDLIQSLGMKISCREHLSHHIGFRKTMNIKSKRLITREVPMIMGACMLVRREVFEDIGLFSLDYSVYGGEDVDFCYRAKQVGYKIINVPNSRVWHKTFQSSGGGYSPRRKYFAARGYVVYMKKHGKPQQWVTFFLFNVLGLLWAFLREGLKGNHRAVFYKARGIYDGFFNKQITDLNFQ